jgi:glycosyltransferase
MKIAIIGHKRIPSNEGGIEKGVEQHAVRMAALGHKVYVYNRGGHNVFGKQYNKKRIRNYKKVRIITIPTTNGRACVPIYSFLATIHAAFMKYDVVSYYASGSCVMIPLAKRLGLKCIASLRGIDSQRDKWRGFAVRYLEFGEQMAAQRADACLVLSKNMKHYIDKRYNANSILSANGIDKPKKLKADIIKRKYNLNQDEYILSLGRIVPEKGLHYLISAFKRCDTTKKLVIAGGAEADREYYNKLRRAASKDKRIIFTGYVTGSEIGELYSNAYIFTLPSNLEGMANTLLESMSYGCCCLVSDIPENTEVVNDKALCFKKSDRDDLYKKLKYLLDNPAVVDDYKSNASEYILKRYNWDLVVNQLLRVFKGERIEYKEVLKEYEAGLLHKQSFKRRS